MTCETTRQRLLKSERPDRPPADVQPHLAACSACREWQRRLTRIERQLPDVPVPPSAPPPSLIRQLLNRPTPPDLPGTSGGPSPWWASSPVSGPNSGPPPWWVNASEAERQGPLAFDRKNRRVVVRSPLKDRARRKVAVAFAATLGLAIFSLCWGLWPRSTPEAPAPQSALAIRQTRLERLLAEVRTPKDKICVLDDFAGRLDREARDRARTASPEDLRDLASLYVQVVRVRLPDYAESLPGEEREQVLKAVAQDLMHTNSEMLRLLEEGVSADSAKPLREIAEAARKGHDRLWKIIREA
jgi:hypothetical protein